MSYSDDPRNLPQNRKRTPGEPRRTRARGYAPQVVPTPIDPDPPAVPDVGPPQVATQPGAPVNVPAQSRPSTQLPQNPPASQPPRSASNPSMSLQPTQQPPVAQQQQPLAQGQRRPAPTARGQAAAVDLPKETHPQHQQAPIQTKAPIQQSQPTAVSAPVQPQAESVAVAAISAVAAAPSTAAEVIQEPEPQQKIDRSKIEFVSGSNLEETAKGEMLLDTEGLVKIYNGRTVVNGVKINVRRGEIVGLLGPNGAGKTTSFYMIVGLVPPNGGTVMFNGVNVTKMPMYKRARFGMGYLPQEESIFRKLTVEENIMAVMQTMPYSRKEKKAKCEELLERFSITHIRKNMAMACSGGEKRRVTIARSLVPDPSLIMLDEPFAGVDPIAVNEIQGIVQDLKNEGLSILLTDHNARQTLELVDRAYLIFEGRVLREGSRDFLVNDPVSRELYLGERFTM